MDAMLARAASLGISEYAVTDHYDPDYPDESFPFDLDFDRYHESLLAMEAKYRPSLRLVKGIEIGIQHGKTMDKCRAAARAFPYDFVLGSFHCADGMDICRDLFFEGREPEDACMAFYRYMLRCLGEYKDYDVLAHFNIIDRYVGRVPDYGIYSELIEDIVLLLINDGKGIEINTSSFRYGMGGRTTPSAEILRHYVRMGGETVTVGSDAHRAEDIGHMLGRAEDMARSAGLRYLAAFKDRKAEYLRI
jgi:histidinol-phosphatase (PHP family)